MINVLLPPYASPPLPGYMRKEFRRRQDTYGLNYPRGSTAVMEDYRGPMTSWIRVMSNGTHTAGGAKREGFILRAGDGFENSYGISPVSSNRKSLIGYDRHGKGHFIDNSDVNVFQKYRPVPGIEGVEVDIRKDVYRLAFIKWKCYSVEQLNYMMPFMFTPYTTVVLEWGWNTYDPSSLIDISKAGTAAKFDGNGRMLENKIDGNGRILENNQGEGLLGAYTNPLLIEQSIKLSSGRYDAMMGHIINFDFTYNPSEQCFNCTTEIASNSRFYFGLSMGNVMPSDAKSQSEELAKSRKTALKFFLTDVRSKLEHHVNDVTSFDVKIKGRVFSPNAYRKENAPLNATDKSGTSIYLSFGLFVDTLNDINRYGPQINNGTIIDISDSVISAHPNLISTSEKFLIPNSTAPYFAPHILIDPSSDIMFPDETYQQEKPIYGKDVKINSELEADKLLLKVVFGHVPQRQDLNKIINYLRIRKIPTAKKGHPQVDETDFQFPSNGPLDEDKYSGKLENIYLSFDFIKGVMEGTNSLKDMLKSICETMNAAIPLIWRLEIVDYNNRITIRDANYINLKHIQDLKEKLGIDKEDPLVYRFDAFTQNSLLKEFSFNVKLSDAIANSVMNSVNNDNSNPESAEISTSGNILGFSKTVDFMLKELKKQTPGGTEVVSVVPAPSAETPSELQKRDELYESRVKAGKTVFHNINERSLSFIKMVDGKKRISRLVAEGEQGRGFLMRLLDDTSKAFADILNSPIPGVKVEFSLLGIAGFRTFQIFLIKNLPKPYDKGILFQVTEVKHSIGREGWITRVTAGLRPIGSIDHLL